MSNETTVPVPRSRWSAKRSAITAGLALLLTSAGAIGAAAALPAGSTGTDTVRTGGGRAGWVPQQNGAPGSGGPGLRTRRNGAALPDQLGGAQPDPNQQDPNQQDPNQQDPNQQGQSSPGQPAAPDAGSSSDPGVLNT